MIIASGATANASAHNVSATNHSIAGSPWGARQSHSPGGTVGNQSIGRGGNFPRGRRKLSIAGTERLGDQELISFCRPAFPAFAGQLHRPAKGGNNLDSIAICEKVLAKTDQFLIACEVQAVGNFRRHGGKTRRALWSDYPRGRQVNDFGAHAIAVHVGNRGPYEFH